jgi:hypothetical protein
MTETPEKKHKYAPKEKKIESEKDVCGAKEKEMRF